MDLGKLKRGTALVFLGSAFSGGAGLLISMLMTRLVTPEEMGFYFLLLQIANMGRMLAEGGTNVGLQRLIGEGLARKDEGHIRASAQASFMITALGLAAVAIGLTFAWPQICTQLFNEPGLLPLLALALIWTLTWAIEDMGSTFFRALHEIRTAVLFIGVPRQFLILITLAIAYLALGEMSFERMIRVVMAGWGFSALISVFLVARRLLKMPKPSPEPGRLKAVGALSMPMLVNGLAAMALVSADLWVIGMFRSTAEVGIYGALMRIATSMAFLVSVVNRVLPPVLAKLYESGDLKQMEFLLRRTALWGAGLAIPMALIFIVLGGWVLTLAFGEAYAVGRWALALLAGAHLINTLAGIPGFVLNMTGSQNLLMRITLGVAIFNLLANLVVVERYGMNGVAAVTALTLLLQNAITVYLVKRRVGVKTYVSFESLFKR